MRISPFLVVSVSAFQVSKSESVSPIDAVVSCNDDENNVQMKVTIKTDQVQRDLTKEFWSKEGDSYVRVWPVNDFTAADIAEKNGQLTLTKLVEKDCEQRKVDDVNICVKTGHAMKFSCSYPLGEMMLSDQFDVGGQDFSSTATSGTGTIHFKLSTGDHSNSDGDAGIADDQYAGSNSNYAIGDEVLTTIKPQNPGLVYAAIKECFVTHNLPDSTVESVPILKWIDSTLVPVTELGASVIAAKSKGDLSFKFNAFKWAMGPDEEQSLTCKIELTL